MRSQKTFRCILARHREAAEQLQSQYIKILENKGEKADGHQRNAGKTYVANKGKAFEIGKSGSVEDYLKDINEIYL